MLKRVLEGSSVNIRLNAHTEAILKKEMASGRFRSPEELIERALESFHKSIRQPEVRRKGRPAQKNSGAFWMRLLKGQTRFRVYRRPPSLAKASIRIIHNTAACVTSPTAISFSG